MSSRARRSLAFLLCHQSVLIFRTDVHVPSPRPYLHSAGRGRACVERLLYAMHSLCAAGVARSTLQEMAVYLLVAVSKQRRQGE